MKLLAAGLPLLLCAAVFVWAVQSIFKELRSWQKWGQCHD